MATKTLRKPKYLHRPCKQKWIEMEGNVMDAIEFIRERQSVFLEQYPEAYVHEDGYLEMRPLEVSAAHRDADGCCSTFGRLCSDCRREFWMQEVE